MVQIKFRAWDKREGKWFGRSAVYLTQVDGDNKPVFIYDEENAEHVELMQFTGLLDKNGKEIYEGDILREKIQGEWQSGYVIETVWDLHVEMNRDDNYYRVTGVEVIGNIHENPELLK